MDPWSVSEQDFPYAGSKADQLRYLVAYAILAPSYSNSQPWLFKVTGNELRLYADRSRALAHSDPQHRNLLISCGMALYHLVVAARRFGFTPRFRSFPDLSEPNLTASLQLGSMLVPSEDDLALFSAIKARQEPAPSPVDADAWLTELRLPSDVVVRAVSEPARLEILAGIIAECDWLLLTGEEFRLERERWARPNGKPAREELTPPVPPPSVLSSIQASKRALLDLSSGELVRLYKPLLESARALLILSTPGNNSPSWLRTGMALDHLLLSARLQGLEATRLFQPLDIGDFRARLDEIEGTSGYLQAVVCIDESAAPVVTPRRPTQDVITRFV